MNLMIKEFPDEVRFKLRLKAFEAGVTFRELVISVLEEWGEGRLKLVGVVEEVPRSRKREGKEGVSSPVREIPVITDEHKPVLPAGKMTLGEEHNLDDNWEPEVPQVSRPWDGCGGRTK